MADFNQRKLQVFVSSTYTDLRNERQAAVEAILAAGHIPAGMELFTAGDESQMEVIQQWIDESDVYLLILGGRYGSIDAKSGKSYTHLEYEYALSKGMPLFACVITDEACEARLKESGSSVIEREQPQKLKEFRSQVLGKVSKFWNDTKDIKISIIETLSHISRREELRGWVRPNTQSDLPALADEIARLSKENAHLRTQIHNTPSEDLINGLSFNDLYDIFEEKRLLPFFFKNARKLGTQGIEINSLSEGNYPELNDLQLLGIVSREGNFSMVNFSLTESGMRFLNKLELLHLREQRLSGSKE